MTYLQGTETTYRRNQAQHHLQQNGLTRHSAYTIDYISWTAYHRLAKVRIVSLDLTVDVMALILGLNPDLIVVVKAGQHVAMHSGDQILLTNEPIFCQTDSI